MKTILVASPSVTSTPASAPPGGGTVLAEIVALTAIHLTSADPHDLTIDQQIACVPRRSAVRAQ